MEFLCITRTQPIHWFIEYAVRPRCLDRWRKQIESKQVTTRLDSPWNQMHLTPTTNLQSDGLTLNPQKRFAGDWHVVVVALYVSRRSCCIAVMCPPSPGRCNLQGTSLLQYNQRGIKTFLSFLCFTILISIAFRRLGLPMYFEKANAPVCCKLSS